jgi:hypothetical protein
MTTLSKPPPAGMGGAERGSEVLEKRAVTALASGALTASDPLACETESGRPQAADPIFRPV